MYGNVEGRVAEKMSLQPKRWARMRLSNVTEEDKYAEIEVESLFKSAWWRLEEFRWYIHTWTHTCTKAFLHLHSSSRNRSHSCVKASVPQHKLKKQLTETKRRKDPWQIWGEMTRRPETIDRRPMSGSWTLFPRQESQWRGRQISKGTIPESHAFAKRHGARNTVSKSRTVSGHVRRSGYR